MKRTQNETTQKVLVKGNFGARPRLTELEKLVLIGLAQGLTNLELELNIRLLSNDDTYHTVIHSLLNKFKACTEPHLVCKAIKAGSIY